MASTSSSGDSLEASSSASRSWRHASPSAVGGATKPPTHLKPMIAPPCAFSMASGTLAAPWTGESALSLVTLHSMSSSSRQRVHLSSWVG
eukprot:4932270-Prymnesium_polylepis.1